MVHRGAANANVLKAVPPNLGGPQANRIWKVEQAAKAKEAQKKRKEYEAEAAAEEERHIAKKSKQPADSKKKATTSNLSKAQGYKPRSQAIPPEEVDENNAYGYGAAGNEDEIPELQPDAMPYANDEDKVPAQEDESSDDDGGEEGHGDDGGEDGGSEEEEERLARIPRRKDSSEAGGGAGRAIVIGGDVDEQYLLQPGRGEETTPERALAKVALISWAVGCDPYPKPEDLLYYRAVMEGMERCEVDGVKNDPKEFFGAATYAYLLHWHTKRMSSARAEYSGVKNIRGVFNATHHFTPDKCRTDEALEELLAKGRELVKDGAWHTDGDGNPFSSDVFVNIANDVWSGDGQCRMTCKQLAWTCLVVQTHLLNKKLSLDRDVNARAMDKQAAEVMAILKKAKADKKKLALKIRPVDKAVDLAAATIAYLESGGGKKKSKKKGSPKNLERDVDVWEDMEKMNEEEEEQAPAA
ncbi:hypothetical protein KFL_012010030 [Klebsormidium nitens]|uniref:Uncharacterized protein n=1 Tax=Klebsormidium nitens TaxID=105231 RepID=A0A1Y1IXB4_KLENI|nr:hypothetical protein KFL_012010030 [Klebsormidium nitens]|eukprot:GAQ92918.1 hypothetical protein KFL_012010030 [Klebsormidium nitens]